MPRTSPLNSACNCCTQPPAPVIGIQWVSASQSCTTQNCGEPPCTSSEAAYDAEGNCTSVATTCSPNWADLTIAEKCANKKYLTITTEDLSGGTNHGRTQVRQYTTDKDANCTLETTCSGRYTVTTTQEGSLSNNFGCDGGDFSVIEEGSMDSTVVDTFVYNEDCTKENTDTTCNGSSDSTSTFTPCPETGYTDIITFVCNSNFDGCSWDGQTTLNGENYETTNGPCINPDPALTTVTLDPPASCAVTVTYTGENEQGTCNPKEFPSFPEFQSAAITALAPFVICFNDEGYTPPDEIEPEEGQHYFASAYKYVNPNNPQIKSEQRAKFRVKHGPSGTCYLKVWFQKVVQKWKYEDCDTGFAGDPTWNGGTPPTTVSCDENEYGSNPCYSRWSTNGKPEFQDYGTYEWRGSGYPCYKDEDKPPFHCNNLIVGTEKELTAGENESITIRFKFGFVEEYEPNWPDGDGSLTSGTGTFDGSQGCKPNGFPIADPADCQSYNPP